MANLKIIKRNVTDSAVSMVATSEATGHLVTSVKNNVKTNTWRSTSLATQTITLTWSSAVPVGGLALPFNNLIQGSTVRVKLYTLSTDSIPVYDSTALNVDFAYDPPSGFTSIGSDSFAYGGGNYFSTFFSEESVEKVDIILTSASNPDNYMELGRVVLGPVFSPSANADYGASTDFTDTTMQDRTDAGVSLADRGIIYRSMSLRFSFLSQSDKAELNRLARSNGKSTPIFVSLLPDSASAEDVVANQIFGRIANDLGVSIESFSLYAASLDIQEI